MISKTTKDFQNEVLNNMTFKPYKTENYTIYKNENKPELGYFIKYSRKDYYEFEIGVAIAWVVATEQPVTYDEFIAQMYEMPREVLYDMSIDVVEYELDETFL